MREKVVDFFVLSFAVATGVFFGLIWYKFLFLTLSLILGY